MKKSDINIIYNMIQTQRQSFKKNYPTAESLAEAIRLVFIASAYGIPYKQAKNRNNISRDERLDENK